MSKHLHWIQRIRHVTLTRSPGSATCFSCAKEKGAAQHNRRLSLLYENTFLLLGSDFPEVQSVEHTNGNVSPTGLE